MLSFLVHHLVLAELAGNFDIQLSSLFEYLFDPFDPT